MSTNLKDLAKVLAESRRNSCPSQMRVQCLGRQSRWITLKVSTLKKIMDILIEEENGKGKGKNS